MSRILGIDHGARRVGIALADEGGKVAVPYRTVEYGREEELFLQLKKIIAEEEIGTIVVGLPLTLRGEEGPQAKVVRAFAERLASAIRSEDRPLSPQRPSLPQSTRIVFIDERMTTPRVGTDADAAAAILQTYLDQRTGK